MADTRADQSASFVKARTDVALIDWQITRITSYNVCYTKLLRYDEVNMPLDDIFLWIEENIPLAYKGKDQLL